MPDNSKNYTWLIQIITPFVTAFIGILMTNTDNNPANDYDMTIWLLLIIITIAAMIGLSLYRKRFDNDKKLLEQQKQQEIDIKVRSEALGNQLRQDTASLSDSMTKAIDALSDRQQMMLDAQHVQMRTTLIHNAEKYLERKWVTSEELRSWIELYDRYDTLGMNGFMRTYLERLEDLDIKPLP